MNRCCYKHSIADAFKRWWTTTRQLLARSPSSSQARHVLSLWWLRKMWNTGMVWLQNGQAKVDCELLKIICGWHCDIWIDPSVRQPWVQGCCVAMQLPAHEFGNSEDRADRHRHFFCSEAADQLPHLSVSMYSAFHKVVDVSIWRTWWRDMSIWASWLGGKVSFLEGRWAGEIMPLKILGGVMIFPRHRWLVKTTPKKTMDRSVRKLWTLVGPWVINWKKPAQIVSLQGATFLELFWVHDFCRWEWQPIYEVFRSTGNGCERLTTPLCHSDDFSDDRGGPNDSTHLISFRCRSQQTLGRDFWYLRDQWPAQPKLKPPWAWDATSAATASGTNGTSHWQDASVEGQNLPLVEYFLRSKSMAWMITSALVIHQYFCEMSFVLGLPFKGTGHQKAFHSFHFCRRSSNVSVLWVVSRWEMGLGGTTRSLPWRIGRHCQWLHGRCPASKALGLGSWRSLCSLAVWPGRRPRLDCL